MELTYIKNMFPVNTLMSGRKYFRIGCEKNEILALYVDLLMIESVHVIIKILISITYICNMIFG